MRTPSQAAAQLRALAEMRLPLETLAPALLEALHGLVPSCRNLLDTTDPQGRLLRYFIEGPIDAKLAQRYFDEFHNRREAEAMPRFDSLVAQPAGVRDLQDLDPARFYRSALYHEIWRPQGFHTRLEAVLRAADGRLLGSLVLYRGPRDRPFTREDARRLAAALPTLARGLEDCDPEPAPDPHLPSPDPGETLLLTLDGEVCHASAGAHRLLLLAEGGASRETLSRPLLHLGRGLVGGLLHRLREAAPGPLAPTLELQHAVPAGRLHARATLLAPLRPGGEPLAQVALRRLEPHRVALERVLAGLPLTPGQMAVCRELYRGGTHADVARRLGVATATVIDHLRKTYGALDLRSAGELRALVDARLGAGGGPA